MNRRPGRVAGFVRGPARIVWAGLVALCGCGADREDRPVSGSASGPERVRVVEELIARFPERIEGAGGPSIEMARGLALGSDRFWVLDGMAGSALSFDWEGKLVARVGRAGEGPGELSGPMTLAAGPDGSVWISEPGVGTLTRLDEAGEVLGEYRTPYPPVNFTVSSDGHALIPTMDDRTLLARVSEDGAVDLPMTSGAIPRELAGGPRDRLALHGLRLVALDDGSVAALRNRHGTDFRLWRVVLGPGAGSVTALEPVPLPRWLYDILEEETERVRRTAPPEFARGDFFVPFRGAHADGGRLWLAPTPGSRFIAVSVWPDSPVGVRGPEDVYRGLVDAAVTGDRLIALYETEVRVYRLGESRETRPSP